MKEVRKRFKKGSTVVFYPLFSGTEFIGSIISDIGKSPVLISYIDSYGKRRNMSVFYKKVKLATKEHKLKHAIKRLQ